MDLVDINFAHTCIAELVHMVSSDTNFAYFMIGIRKRRLERIRNLFLDVREQKHNFCEYYVQLSEEHDAHQVHRLQGRNQLGWHFYHMNLNRVNMPDNADCG